MQRIAVQIGLFLFVAAGLSPASVAAAARPFEIQILAPTGHGVTPAVVVSGALDGQFQSYQFADARHRGGTFWLKLQALAAYPPEGVPVLTIRKGRHLHVTVFADHAGTAVPLVQAAELAGFRGVHDTVLVLPEALRAGQVLYARVEPNGRGAEALAFSTTTLDQALAIGAAHARTIAWTFGALVAMSVAALLIWFVLTDQMFILYAALFSMQALYIAYLSGQGLDWPVLSYARSFSSLAWNVPAALSGAAACLFTREIADLRHFSPRIHRVFGWFAVAFVLLALANLAKFIGLGPMVATFGNVIFLIVAAFTLVTVFMAWRRGNRASGWFLIAWGLLEIFTIATTLSWLLTDSAGVEFLLYFGLPLSMVGAAVLIALGVADRLREQRAALTDAERRAQTDPLTGVLNRRSLLERLEAACSRAQARGLPIAVLFIDLDHFKSINDAHGHPAGDACLAAIIGPIQTELRQSDVVGRYGGEEFVVILSSADIAAARPIAERIVARIGQLRVEGFGKPIGLTCSIGVATSDMLGVWGTQLIARADAAVYAAKNSGRNQVQVAEALAA